MRVTVATPSLIVIESRIPRTIYHHDPPTLGPFFFEGAVQIASLGVRPSFYIIVWLKDLQLSFVHIVHPAQCQYAAISHATFVGYNSYLGNYQPIQ